MSTSSQILGLSLTTAEVLGLLRRDESGPDGTGSDGPTDRLHSQPEPQRVGNIIHNMWVGTIAENHRIEPSAVQVVLDLMPLASEGDMVMVERVLACRPTVSEAAEWAAAPPTMDQAALIAALRS